MEKIFFRVNLRKTLREGGGGGEESLEKKGYYIFAKTRIRSLKSKKSKNFQPLGSVGGSKAEMGGGGEGVNTIRSELKQKRIEGLLQNTVREVLPVK